MPLSAARPGGPACADGRPKHEPDLWHLHGGRHNPFEIGRLTLEIAELFASVSWRAIPAHAPSQRSGLGVQDHRLRKTYQRASGQSPYDRDQRTIPSTSSAAGMSCQRMTSRCAIPSGTCSTVTSQNLVPTDASPRLVCTGGPPRFFPISGPNRRRPRRNLPAPRPVAPKFFIATMHSTALDDRRSGLPSGSDV